MKKALFPVIIIMTAGMMSCSLFKSKAEADTKAEANPEVTPVAGVTIKERAQSDPDTASQVYRVVEDPPRFPGGEEARIAYMAENITYPKEAIKQKIQGVVYVSFVVETDGSISNVKVLRGIGGGCDKEAVRVVQNMPRWKPGTQRGTPVRVSFILPLKFSISD